MYLDKEEREMYENDLKLLRIQKAEIKTAEEKGIEKGIEKGEHNKSIEIAKNLLDVLDVEVIAKKTGLTVKEIEKLKLD
jgi:predicted transposase/invertase (TIGR01784 family)